MTGAPRIDGYDWVGGREAMLRFGPDTGPVVIAALPLFEEANRTRAFVVAILRALAVRGIGSVLPDLPGQGESLVALDTVSLLDMQTAFENGVDRICADGRRAYSVSVRSGALIDTYAMMYGRWHFAPQGGQSLLHELKRIKQAEFGDTRRLSDLWYFDGALREDAPDPPVEVAGNLVSTEFLTDLSVKEPYAEADVPRRIVRLSTDPAPADRKLDGAPLWRRSEPGTDAALSQILADDIADWMAACEG